MGALFSPPKPPTAPPPLTPPPVENEDVGLRDDGADRRRRSRVQSFSRGRRSAASLVTENTSLKRLFGE